MNCKQKRQHLQKVMERIEHILGSDDLELLISTKDLKMLEIILNVKKTKCSEVEKRVISGKGFKKKKSHK